MNLHLYVKYDDVQAYLAGEEIKAATKEHKAVIFEHSDFLVEVDVPAWHVVMRGTLSLNGWVKGDFPYLILKNPHKELF